MSDSSRGETQAPREPTSGPARTDVAQSFEVPGESGAGKPAIVVGVLVAVLAVVLAIYLAWGFHREAAHRSSSAGATPEEVGRMLAGPDYQTYTNRRYKFAVSYDASLYRIDDTQVDVASGMGGIMPGSRYAMSFVPRDDLALPENSMFMVLWAPRPSGLTQPQWEQLYRSKKARSLAVRFMMHKVAQAISRAPGFSKPSCKLVTLDHRLGFTVVFEGRNQSTGVLEADQMYVVFTESGIYILGASSTQDEWRFFSSEVRRFARSFRYLHSP
jgi:hypothetical protein